MSGNSINNSIVDVRIVPPARRHPVIFARLEQLTVGESIVLVNDHDPKPLYYQIRAEMPGEFDWEYIEAGPEDWRVRISRVAPPAVAPDREAAGQDGTGRD